MQFVSWVVVQFTCHPEQAFFAQREPALSKPEERGGFGRS
jgi:hypothetical protein